MPNIQHKRGTRAALDALAGANGLVVGQIYVITDEDRLAVATGAGTYQAMAKEGEGGGAAKAFDYAINTAGRIYSESDARWICLSDDNYGTQYVNQSETAGTGVDPIYEWNNLGELLKAGQTIVTVDLAMRTNDRVNSSDLEILLSFIQPDSASRLLSGWDNNAEVTHTTLYRGSWVNDPTPFTWLVDDYHWRTYEINFTVPANGWFTMFVKPTRGTASTARDYYYYRSMLQLKAALAA